MALGRREQSPAQLTPAVRAVVQHLQREGRIQSAGRAVPTH
jgi:hypothetical protein